MRHRLIDLDILSVLFQDLAVVGVAEESVLGQTLITEVDGTVEITMVV